MIEQVKNVLDADTRRTMKAGLKSKDTTPEILFPRAPQRLGYRFRLHRHDLPGKPDIVLPKQRTAILVHGCCWNQHNGCGDRQMPKAKKEEGTGAFRRNAERDAITIAALVGLNWNSR